MSLFSTQSDTNKRLAVQKKTVSLFLLNGLQHKQRGDFMVRASPQIRTYFPVEAWTQSSLCFYVNVTRHMFWSQLLRVRLEKNMSRSGSGALSMIGECRWVLVFSLSPLDFLSAAQSCCSCGSRHFLHRDTVYTASHCLSSRGWTRWGKNKLLVVFVLV